MPWSTLTVTRQPPQIIDKDAYYLMVAPRGALQAYWLCELCTQEEIQHMEDAKHSKWDQQDVVYVRAEWEPLTEFEWVWTLNNYLILVSG